MLEPQDIQKLMEVLATKDDIRELKEEVADLKLTVHGLVTAVDGLIARVEALNHEYLVLKERDTRYERWFHEIAEKVGITLTV
jgi:hypothetical protein